MLSDAMARRIAVMCRGLVLWCLVAHCKAKELHSSAVLGGAKELHRHVMWSEVMGKQRIVSLRICDAMN